MYNKRWQLSVLVIRLALIFLILNFVLVSSSAQDSLQKLQDVSAKTQNLVSYIYERTVAIKIMVGSKMGFGSGAIISEDGLILTCAHVAEVSDQIAVVNYQGDHYEATRLGMNSHNDYAVIRISGGPFPYFELGDSDTLEMLQWVIAVGHPGGPYPDYRPAIATGRIRGFHKKLPIQLGVKFYDDALQTDVPIFAGNSGGPLLDISGKLIGINGAIALINDLAFSIPINEIKQDLKQLQRGIDVEGRKAQNIFQILMELQEDIPQEDVYKLFKDTPFGRIFKLFGQEFTMPPSPRPEFGAKFASDSQGNVVVKSVAVNSIAQMAGLRKNDRIVSADRTKISSAKQIRQYLQRMRNKDKAILQTMRGNTARKALVVFDRKAYSRDHALQRVFVYNGLDLMDVTVQILSNGERIGYGVIIGDGWVLTCNQMLVNAQNFTLKLHDAQETIYPLQIHGRNGILDIALLKFHPQKKMRAISLGDDKKLRVGSWVVSGGNQSGIIQAGIVSALNRYVPSNRKIPTLGLFGLFGKPNKTPVRAYKQVIQHDSNLESGQFGTPLVNEQGELVGINTGHFYRGTTFATPMSLIAKVLPKLKAGVRIGTPPEFQPYEPELDPFSELLQYFLQPDNKKSKPLGNILRDMWKNYSQKKPQKTRSFLGVQVKPHWRGAEVTHVIEGNAAASGGIRVGDVITEINKQKINSVVDLVEALKKLPPKTKIKIVILRKGKIQKLDIILDQYPKKLPGK